MPAGRTSNRDLPVSGGRLSLPPPARSGPALSGSRQCSLQLFCASAAAPPEAARPSAFNDPRRSARQNATRTASGGFRALFFANIVSCPRVARPITRVRTS